MSYGELPYRKRRKGCGWVDIYIERLLKNGASFFFKERCYTLRSEGKRRFSVYIKTERKKGDR